MLNNYEYDSEEAEDGTVDKTPCESSSKSCSRKSSNDRTAKRSKDDTRVDATSRNKKDEPPPKKARSFGNSDLPTVSAGDSTVGNNRRGTNSEVADILSSMGVSDNRANMQQLEMHTMQQLERQRLLSELLGSSTNPSQNYLASRLQFVSHQMPGVLGSMTNQSSAFGGVPLASRPMILSPQHRAISPEVLQLLQLQAMSAVPGSNTAFAANPVVARAIPIDLQALYNNRFLSASLNHQGLFSGGMLPNFSTGMQSFPYGMTHLPQNAFALQGQNLQQLLGSVAASAPSRNEPVLNGAGAKLSYFQDVSDEIPHSLPAVLARPEDTFKLSSHQVLLRHQIEAFQATEDDISTHTRGRNKPITLGQVGIRCRHCAHLPVARRQKGSTYFPATLLGLYQAAQNMSTTHMQCGLCSEMPESIKAQFAHLIATKVASSGAGRPYWAESAKKLGLVDTEDGIQFIRDLKPGARLIEKEPESS
jgi:hypothetical protein